MYKYKRIALIMCTFLFIVFSFIELIKFLFVDSNMFGVIYLIINLFIIFLLLPTAYNYKKYFSTARISKLIIIILVGLFNSFLLSTIVLKNLNYIDSSKRFIENIFIYKSIFKPIIYFILFIITIFEFRVEKIFKSNKKD